jgi:hypothetical protein
VHEIAQGVDPWAKVVYVDIDPVAVEQSRSLLVGNPYARAVRGDLREPEKILYDPQVVEFLDFSRPIAVLTLAVLHFIPDSGDPAALISRLGAEIVAGSYLVLSHLGPETRPEARAKVEEARKLYERTPTPVVERTPEQLQALLGDAFELQPPGIVSADEWRPDPGEDATLQPQPAALVAVARKR